MTANRRSAQWPLGLVDTNGNRLNQARVIVNPRESHSRSFDRRLRARAPYPRWPGGARLALNFSIK
jgi:hypothetical protein